MKVEIIAVGSELLLGQITNTNATFMSARLAEIGVDIHYHTVVGDNPERLEDVIRIAESRADVLIFSGGLGPTKDDMTKETIAKHIDSTLVSDDEALQYIEKYFARSKRKMTENNKKQALVLKGATVLANRTGMAPGMAVKNEAIPYLLGVIGKQEVITSRVLKFYGIGEAELEHLIQPILEKQSNPTVAPLATADSVTLRITAKSESVDTANKLIDPIEEEIRSIVGDYIYGVDDDSLSSKAVDLLKKKGFTLAAAESLTAGLFMAELANEPGISSTLSGGVVVYNNDVKISELGVEESLLDEHGAVSKECAASLAINVQRKFASNVGVGITGAAGPTSHGGEPAGIVWIGIVFPDEKPVTYKLDLSGMRNTNRLRSARFALYYLIKELSKLK